MLMTRLFRLDDARPRHPDVEQWLAEKSGPLGAIAAHWFARLRAAGHEVCEVMHDGQPTACVRGAAFAYVAVYRAHVNVGFFHGAELPDPHGVLQGTGRFMRHVTIKHMDTVNAAALEALIHAAYTTVMGTLAQSASVDVPYQNFARDS
jgi:hypothetical protein